jgi:hypothetical protein
VYFFPLIVNVTSVSELQQEKQHLSTSVSVLHGFANTEMYLFVVPCKLCKGLHGNVRGTGFFLRAYSAAALYWCQCQFSAVPRCLAHPKETRWLSTALREGKTEK